MVGNGNHPLGHYDDDILEEYVLGQLLPAEEDTIRGHLAECVPCRAAETDIRAFCRRLELDLRTELDRATPGPQLTFDRIAAEWRRPPRRVEFAYKLRQRAPSASSLLLIVLFAAAFLLLFSSNGTAALSSLELAKDYYGPPAIVAATTESGLVVVRFSPGQAEVVMRLARIRDPRNPQFSPDGQWLAFQQDRQLHIVETHSGGADIRLDARESADWSWSPDGRTLAYTDGAGQLAIFDVAARSNQVLVPAEDAAWGKPIWSADGQQIAYAVANPLPTAGGPPLRQGLWRVLPATGFRVELTRTPNPGSAVLVPAAWAAQDTVLLAWDMNAAAQGRQPALYLVDVNGHSAQRLEGLSLAQGMRLAWPVSAQGEVVAMIQDELVFVDLANGARRIVPTPIPWPQALDWAPNGAWFAYTVAGATEGEGLYLYAPHEGELRPVELPPGATEKHVLWAGAEHLFVIRQPGDGSICELWLVPLTTGEPPQRVMTHLRPPLAEPQNGFRWQDIVTTQVIAP